MKVLVMHDNLITKIGAKAIAGALTRNEALQELHLCENIIKDVGVEAIAKAVKKHSGLR